MAQEPRFTSPAANKTMKSSIKAKQYKIPKNFPKLMTTQHGLIVLMSEYGKGMAVASELTDIIGKYTDWDMEHFCDFDGVLELSN